MIIGELSKEADLQNWWSAQK